MTFLYVLGAAALGLLGYIAWKLQIASGPADATAEIRGKLEEAKEIIAQLKANLETKNEEVGSLKAMMEGERAEKVEQQGKSKQLFAQHTKLEAQLEQAQRERDVLQKQLTKHEEAAERREREMHDMATKLATATASLAQERERVIREDEEQRRAAEEERDRIWAEHEKNVIARLTELCKRPEYAFSCYTNTELPDGFDGSLKPDFMIEFLDQYVIFDAKKSKSESLQTYISNTIKSTVTKVKKNPRIATTIFLVVPTEAVSELKVHHHVHDGYTLYVISPEALAPVLASLKRITAYEFAEQMDPQKRENMVQLIAELDFHINLRNAADIFLSNLGAEIVDKAQRVDPELAEEVALKKQPMNAKAAIAASEIKRLVVNVALQKEEIGRLASPRAAVSQKNLEQAKALLSDNLFE